MAHDNGFGKITRMFINDVQCTIKLDEHGDREFALLLEHRNYNAIYSLLVAAFVNRYRIWLRLRDYNPSEPPSSEVQYLVVDWPQG